ncbi:MAG: hypothetical protein Q9160_007548 [Pyrenula sp. 1 TL-2023]
MAFVQLFIYPIKSLQGTSVSSWEATRRGLKYDRRFMLVRKSDRKNMHLSDFPAMSLFSTVIEHPDEAEKVTVRVNYKQDDKDSLHISMNPSTEDLEVTEISMHSSPTKAYNMGAQYDQWFTDRFGYEVNLLYLGDNIRKVLGNVSPTAVADSEQRQQGLSSWLPTWAATGFGLHHDGPGGLYDGITFADCAPYLLVTEESMKDVNNRLPSDDNISIVKFRPNIVLHGAKAGYEEDFWAELSVDSRQDLKIILTQNCLRCRSINVDYSLGEPGQTESGNILKKLMKDRRVDGKKKYSPVFGRYGFLDMGSEKTSTRLEVGEEVEVSRMNNRRTSFGKFLHCQHVPERSTDLRSKHGLESSRWH